MSESTIPPELRGLITEEGIEDMHRGVFHFTSVEVAEVYPPRPSVTPGGFLVRWAAEGVGFGEVTFRVREDGSLEIDTEMMGKGFVKALLCRLVDGAVTDRPEDGAS